MVFCSGQIPLDPKTGNMVAGSITEQTNRVLLNLTAVMKEAGGGLSNVVKTTVFLADMNDFQEMNKEYARHFGDHKPARAAVQAAALPKGARVEIEAIAVLD
jgi:2-iminobutanoate/2-iminopropanoate deaminase